MKKIFYLSAIALTAIACTKNDAVTFSGSITNPNSDSLVIANPQFGYTKTIKLDENGSFKDTLQLQQNGFFSVFDGKQYLTTYFQKGDDINMSFDTQNYDETLTFSGKGAEESNFLVTSTNGQKELLQNQTLFSLEKDEFESKLNGFVTDFNKNLSNQELDSAFVVTQKNYIANLQNQVSRIFEERNYVATVLSKGKPSPVFTNYENYKGGTTSLQDLKGKYVYIDLWATWCQPCKAEIPYLQKVEKQFHNKNIEFVSISIDSKKDHDAWKNMVKDKNLGGVQLYAGDDKTFTTAYRVSGIPRFILLDKDGNIVDSNAPRPSNPKLIEVLNNIL